jgi:predicted ATPase
MHPVDPVLMALPRALAEVFGLPEAIGRTHAAALVERLAGEHMLLILDTCEHLVAACAALVEALLAGCPHLHILATSREPLQAAWAEGAAMTLAQATAVSDPAERQSFQL